MRRRGNVIPHNQYHVGLYGCAAAILAALAGMKDTQTQGAEGLAIARVVKVDKLAAGWRETCHQ